jgi:sulfofructose kinase
LLKALARLSEMFKFHLIAATIGRLGVIAWDGGRFILCPGFRVKAIDTTGAGDVFHGAFLYGMAHGWTVEETLEFGCAAAALNCEALGARGGIASLDEIDNLRRHGERSELAYAERELNEAALAAKDASLLRGTTRIPPVGDAK